MRAQQRIVLLTAIMLSVAAAVGGTVLCVLYRVALTEEQARLRENAQLQARLIEAIAGFELAHGASLPGDASDATLAHVRNAYEQFEESDRKVEYVLGRRAGDAVEIILRDQEDARASHPPITMPLEPTQPLQRALAGKSGTTIARDYRGEEVVAAYEPVGKLGLGLVAKIDLAEIRAPFVMAGVQAGGVAIVLVTIGSVLCLRVGNPLVRQFSETEDSLRASEQFARAALNGLSAGIAIVDAQGTIVAVNQAWRDFAQKNSPDPANLSEGANYLQVCAAAQGVDAPLAHAFAHEMRAVLERRAEQFAQEYACHSPTEQRWFMGRVTRFPAGEIPHIIVAHEDITARKEAENRLSEQKDLLDQIVTTVPHYVFWKDRHSVYLGCNERFARVAGLASAAEVRGKTDYELAWTREEADWYRRCDQEVMSKAEALLNIEEPQLQASGRRATLLTSKVPLHDAEGNIAGVVGIFADITDRKQAEEQLRASEQRWADLVRESPDGIVTLDTGGCFLSCNPAAEQIVRMKEHALVGRSFRQIGIFQGDALRQAEELFARVCAGERIGSSVLPFRLGDGSRRYMEFSAMLVTTKSSRIHGTLRDVTEREGAAHQIRLLNVALQATTDAVVITDAAGQIEWANNAFQQLTGYTVAEVLGRNTRFLKSGRQDGEFYERMWKTIASGTVWTGRLENRRKDGRFYLERMTITPVRSDRGKITHYVAFKHDVTQERILESQRLQAQKLESIGQLAAGIAHEINTPTQFVSDNTRFLEQAVRGLLKLVDTCTELLNQQPAEVETGRLRDRLAAALGELELDFLREEVPKAIAQSLEGLARVSTILRAMKDFSHPATDELKSADLNQAIESTVMIARNEWKYVADVQFDLDRQLPPVPVSLGEFNQVILNLVINAAHAIQDVVGRGHEQKGEIRISTRAVEGAVEIRVADTGTGIAEQHREKIFEHFFTTKGVGRGTGQGLSLARSIIVERHGGTLTFETEVGRGTTFIIRLPSRNTSRVEA